MGTSNGLDDYSVDSICEYSESYGYIHVDDIERLKKTLEAHGYSVIEKDLLDFTLKICLEKRCGDCCDSEE